MGASEAEAQVNEAMSTSSPAPSATPLAARFRGQAAELVREFPDLEGHIGAEYVRLAVVVAFLLVVRMRRSAVALARSDVLH